MRESRAQDAVLTDYAHTVIRFKARQLSRSSGFSRSDQDDLEQELWTVLLSQADNFDPDRASIDTFIDRVVKSAVLMILRDRRRQKRANGFHTQSIDASPQQHGRHAAPASVEPDAKDRGRHRSAVPIDEQQCAENRDAAKQALDEMPALLREVCQKVMGGSVNSAARDLGKSRRQIRKALNQARPYLERAGFRDL